ncbi:phage tail protein [Niallia taxi]|uniref:prophage endopeptidase tail family protein n=1 Tax=Niallia taxi TaxID=2499688 RepID=UPI002934E41F|nr:prophage endopeptidase tail family protein [Niallia taxi]WOD61756.1 phage tail protein [Niallia taxi]
MKDSELLIIKDRKGNTEPLYGFTCTLKEGEQGAKTLSVSGTKSEENEIGFDMIQQRNYFVYKNEEYIIKKVGRRVTGERVKIDCSNEHRFFDDLKRKRIYETIKGSFSPYYLLDMVFKDTGYTYVLNPETLPELLDYEDFGGNNNLALFQEIIGDLGAEFDYTSGVVHIASKLGIVTEKQFLHKFNINDINEDTDSSNFATYIRGYGKPKEEKDVSSNKSIPYESKTGTYYTESTQNKPATKEIGATFSFKFTGTGFSFRTIVHKMGGKWEFAIGDTNKTITTYSKEEASEQTIEVVRGLESKEYSVKATFKKDTDNPNTKVKNSIPFNYLLDGNIITLFRQLEGDEQYTCVTEYTSPLAEEYGIVEAEPLFSDTITNATVLYETLKKGLYDSWDISLSLTAQELVEMGLSDINRLDYAYCILDPLNVDLQLRIVEKESYSDPNISPKFTFGTIKKKGTDIIASLSTSSQTISKVVDSKTGQIKESALSGTMVFNLAYAIGVLAANKVRIGAGTIFEDGYDPREIAAGVTGLADETSDGLLSSEDFVKISKIIVGEEVVDLQNLMERLEALENGGGTT